MQPPSLRVLWSRQVKLGPSVAVALVVAVLIFLLAYRMIRLPSGGDIPTHLGIDTLITQVRSDLEELEIERQSAGTQPLFELQNFDLEISFVVRQSAKANGGLETEVVTVGGETERSNEAAQKITLHMSAIAPQLVVIPAVKHIDVPSDAVRVKSKKESP